MGHYGKGGGSEVTQINQKDFKSLAETHPTLAKEWHPTKNGSLTPEMVSKGCTKKIWWKLSYDVPMDYSVEHLRGKHFDFEWESSVNSRTNNNTGCPFLSGKAIWKGFNDLETVNPDLAKQWDYEANKGIKDKNGNDISTPDKVTACSSQEVWWMLPYDDLATGKHFDFEWTATIDNRTTSDSMCPYISGKAAWKGFNDLKTKKPELAEQWHPLKNIGLKDGYGRDISSPDKITAGSNQKVWWYLPYDVPADYPIEHLRGKHFDFEWEASVNQRNSEGSKCPFLSGAEVWKGFNDLITTNRELALEWHPIKNKGLKDKNGRDISTPDKVTEHSGIKVWWQYLHKDIKTGKEIYYEWQSIINDRSNGAGCPFIMSSKGEKAVRKLLRDRNIYFEEQYKFKNRRVSNDKYKHPLRDDFAIFDKYGEVVATIEFNGRQHYEPVDFAGRGAKWAKEEFEKIKVRDKAKSAYLKSHNIKQLIIPYTEFDVVEKLVEDFVQELSQIHDLFQPVQDILEWKPQRQLVEEQKQRRDFIANIYEDNQQVSPKTNTNSIGLKEKDLDISI